MQFCVRIVSSYYSGVRHSRADYCISCKAAPLYNLTKAASLFDTVATVHHLIIRILVRMSEGPVKADRVIAMIPNLDDGVDLSSRLKLSRALVKQCELCRGRTNAKGDRTNGSKQTNHEHRLTDKMGRP